MHARIFQTIKPQQQHCFAIITWFLVIVACRQRHARVSFISVG
jgi:hypothetical protein